MNVSYFNSKKKSTQDNDVNPMKYDFRIDIVFFLNKYYIKINFFLPFRIE